MSRLSSQDPLDKFRFRFTVFEPFGVGIISTPTPTSDQANSQSQFYAGFSDITSPRITFNEITYRENVYGGFVKKPGIPKYDPIILRKGVTLDSKFYDWVSEVHDPALDISVAVQALSEFIFQVKQTQKPGLRKDALISVLERDGSFKKHWYLFNCFPISYKPGNDLAASEDGKLIEEFSIVYEGFIEIVADSIQNAINGVSDKISKAENEALIAAAISII